MNNNMQVVVVSCLLVGITIGYFLGSLNFSQLQQCDENKTIEGLSRTSKYKKAFFLGVTITFKSIEDKKYFIREFSSYAKFVGQYEPSTISYELLESDKDELMIYIAERYESKEKYLEVHRKTNQFNKFRENLSILTANGKATITGQSFIESNLGFFQ
eukprot:gene10045-13503_t